MASILEVVTGISQAISAKHHGGAEIGLKRETEDLLQGCSIYDPRVMDGFGVQYQGNMLILKYHSEMPLTKVHDKNFETDIRQTMKDIKKFIEKEYKKVTKKSLSLTEYGDTNTLVQSANRRTSYVNASQTYIINDVEGYSKEDSKPQENYSDIAKRWLMNCRKPKTYLKENKSLNFIQLQEQKIVEEGFQQNVAAAILALALSAAAQANPKLKSTADAVARTNPQASQTIKLDKKAIKKAAVLAKYFKTLDVSELTKGSASDEIGKALQGAGGVGTQSPGTQEEGLKD